jgi:hypothetical protein
VSRVRSTVEASGRLVRWIHSRPPDAVTRTSPRPCAEKTEVGWITASERPQAQLHTALEDRCASHCRSRDPLFVCGAAQDQ